MPDPLTSELMHVLGPDAAAKWLFAQIVPFCRALRRRPGQPRLITRVKVEELCRAHYLPVEALDALLGAVDDEGAHLFLEPCPEDPDAFRLPDFWCDSTARARTARYRLKLIDAGVRDGAQVADGALRDLAGAAAAPDFVTVTKLGAAAVEAPALFPEAEAPAVRWVRGDPPAAVVQRIHELWWATYKGENPKARYRNLTTDRRRAIVAALKRFAEGRGQEGRDEAVELCGKAVQGWVHDSFGDRAQFAEIKIVLRTGNAEKFADWFDGVNLPRHTVSVPRETPATQAAANAGRARARAEELRRQRAGAGSA